MELLHEAHKLHPGAIGRRLLITRQSADHLVHQLRRVWLVDTWRLDGESFGVALTGEGRTRITQSLRALRPTFEPVETLDTATRTRLGDDLQAFEDALRSEGRLSWLEP
jgi:hypothetical protein